MSERFISLSFTSSLLEVSTSSFFSSDSDIIILFSEEPLSLLSIEFCKGSSDSGLFLRYG